jgi:hypothetical protein
VSAARWIVKRGARYLSLGADGLLFWHVEQFKAGRLNRPHAHELARALRAHVVRLVKRKSGGK